MARKTTHLWAEVQGWLDGLNWAPSQAALASRLGLKSRSVITDWKYGASRPTPEHLLRLAHEMELLGGPDTYRRLVYAVIADLGYDIALMHPKHRASADDLRSRKAREYAATAFPHLNIPRDVSDPDETLPSAAKGGEPEPEGVEFN